MTDTPKITSIEKKVKDPRRVEAGKRLAAISKQAKERKAKERENLDETPSYSESYFSLEYAGLLIGAAGVAVGIAGLFYTRKNNSENINNEEEEKIEEKEEEVTQKPKTKTKLDSFD